MSYLTEHDLLDIKDNVSIVSITQIDDISHYPFNCHINEYNTFLDVALKYDTLNVSKTFLLLHNQTDELLAYMTLSSDSIKLTNKEKDTYNMSDVPYASIPALKVGKLAVNKELSDTAKQKGYGSFLLYIAQVYAFKMNSIGVACRFITVDADIEYNPKTPDFYLKNGFAESLKNKSRNPKHTISMLKDIF